MTRSAQIGELLSRPFWRALPGGVMPFNRLHVAKAPLQPCDSVTKDTVGEVHMLTDMTQYVLSDGSTVRHRELKQLAREDERFPGLAKLLGNRPFNVFLTRAGKWNAAEKELAAMFDDAPFGSKRPKVVNELLRRYSWRSAKRGFLSEYHYAMNFLRKLNGAIDGSSELQADKETAKFALLLRSTIEDMGRVMPPLRANVHDSPDADTRSVLMPLSTEVSSWAYLGFSPAMREARQLQAHIRAGTKPVYHRLNMLGSADYDLYALPGYTPYGFSGGLSMYEIRPSWAKSRVLEGWCDAGAKSYMPTISDAIAERIFAEGVVNPADLPMHMNRLKYRTANYVQGVPVESGKGRANYIETPTFGMLLANEPRPVERTMPIAIVDGTPSVWIMLRGALTLRHGDIEETFVPGDMCFFPAGTVAKIGFSVDDIQTSYMVISTFGKSREMRMLTAMAMAYQQGYDEQPLDLEAVKKPLSD